MRKVNPLDPDAPAYTPIDLRTARRAHPDDGADHDGNPALFLNEPTPEQLDAVAAATRQRVADYERDPYSKLGGPNDEVLCWVYGGNVTVAGALSGYDVVRVGLCGHGLMPAIRLDDGRLFEYIDALGMYFPAACGCGGGAG